MINKKSLWFLTLFSLILVLSVYYITMPSELLMNDKTNISSKDTSKKTNSKTSSKKSTSTKTKKTVKTKEDTKTKTEVKESNTLETMRAVEDEEVSKELESLQVVLNDDKSSVDEKNKAYDKMKELNNNKAEEASLEDKIKKDFELDSYVKIEGDKIKVVINSSEHDMTLANKIMRSIQSNYKDNKYITVKFQK